MTAADPCREAARLVELYRADEQKLRHARRQLSELSDQLTAELPLRDRTQLVAAKARAQEDYHELLAQAADASAGQRAASAWLNEISRLNQAAFKALRHGPEQSERLTRLENYVHRLELEVHASRIRAEAAREACNDARRAAAAAAELEQARLMPAQRLDRLGNGPEPPIAGLLRGDRLILQHVAERLSESTENEAGRLQLLLIELSEQIAASALEAAAITFPPDHPFWSLFERDEARLLATTLSHLGYRYDGRDGWLDELVPQPRHLALALAHSGLDGRLRHQPTQEQIDTLWQGARLESGQHLAHRAPDLTLEQVQDLLAKRASLLDDLWDNWAEVRKALMQPAG